MHPAKCVLLIRHATTDLAGTLCGHLDPALNAVGRLQAENLADTLRELPTDRIYSSDLLRAMQTADAVARPRGLHIMSRPGLREISFGAWEGLRWRELQPALALDSGIESSWGCPPGGESFERFQVRVADALNEIALDDKPGMAIVITHLGVIRTALTLLAGTNLSRDETATIDYCSGCRFAVTNGTWAFNGRLSAFDNLQFVYSRRTT